jgi:hypothetical protein
MKSTFQLWDTDDNNLIGFYSSEQEALQVVRDGISAHGADAFVTVALGDSPAPGRLRMIAEGPDLVRLAIAETSLDAHGSVPTRKAS